MWLLNVVWFRPPRTKTAVCGPSTRPCGQRTKIWAQTRDRWTRTSMSADNRVRPCPRTRTRTRTSKKSWSRTRTPIFFVTADMDADTTIYYFKNTFLRELKCLWVYNCVKSIFLDEYESYYMIHFYCFMTSIIRLHFLMLCWGIRVVGKDSWKEREVGKF